MNRCGAKTKQGGLCRRPAGAGTDHVGEGRCKHHGGASATPEPFNLLPEVAQIRALAANYLEHQDELVEALLAWNAEEEAEARQTERKPRPQPIPRLELAADLLEQGSRVTERADKIRKTTALTAEQVVKILQNYGGVVAQALARHLDEKTAAKVAREIEKGRDQLQVLP